VASHADNIDDIDADTECMAKVVHHEAANQPLAGQLAVAEVILNREHSGHFPTTACAVANQRGQFFQTESYHVPRASPRWRTAVAIARVAQTGEAHAVVPGALYFHASYVRTPPSHRRAETIQIADQVFYR
jgi:spore germination cell wall hydrolase CwlJ-like protein